MKARIVDRPPDPREPEDPEHVARLYRRLGSVRAVARQLERGSQLVRGILREQGVELRNEGTRDPKVRDLFVAWRNMIRRCDDPTHRSYPNYGARSIGYSADWAEFPPFRAWALEHGWRPGLSLLLRDPDRDHAPDNCYWGSRAEMLRLRSRVQPLTAQPITAFHEVKSAWAWARDPRCRITYMGLMQRLRRGWPAEDALTTVAGAPWPKRRVRPRAIHRLGPRIDWDTAVALRREGWRVEDVAEAIGCAPSSLYSGFRARGLHAGRASKRRRLDDGPLYATWDRMRQLCRGKYRGRRDAQVPTMDPRWEDYEVFRKWARSLRYRTRQCLVRLDPTLAYGPTNCRFVRRSEITSRPQAHRKPLGKPRFLIRALGAAKGLADWARDKRCTVTAVTIARRLRAGWRPDDAITAPPLKPGSSGHADRLVTAFGQTKGIVEWTRDQRCKVSAQGLASRLRRGVDPETAIAARAYDLHK